MKQRRCSTEKKFFVQISGDRICFNISEQRSRKSVAQALFISANPFYSPQEFSSFILHGVYIPPQVCVSAALQCLADQITSVEREHPGSLLIISGDFKKSEPQQ